jgi:hypothetical protein
MNEINDAIGCVNHDCAKCKAVQEPAAWETVYETIIHWDEGGGKRSRRELARRIVDLYTTPPAQPSPEQYTALEQALTRLQKRYAELEAKAAAKPAVPEGWKMVPVEPTKEMAGVLQWFDRGSPLQIKEGWKEVLAAAPEKGQP